MQRYLKHRQPPGITVPDQPQDSAHVVTEDNLHEIGTVDKTAALEDLLVLRQLCFRIQRNRRTERPLFVDLQYLICDKLFYARLADSLSMLVKYVRCGSGSGAQEAHTPKAASSTTFGLRKHRSIAFPYRPCLVTGQSCNCRR